MFHLGPLWKSVWFEIEWIVTGAGCNANDDDALQTVSVYAIVPVYLAAVW